MAGAPKIFSYEKSEQEQSSLPSGAPLPITRNTISETSLRSELEAVSRHLEIDREGSDTGPVELTVLRKYSYLSLGGLCVALGSIGVFVPGLPTTVFMIVALWAFTKSSPKMRDWLYYHRHFGPALQDWVSHRSIPVRARQFALVSLLISALITSQTFSGLACLAFILFVCAPVASFLWTLPNSPDS